ncbi:MAG: hypothetical protein AAGJ32_11240 [Pseudomonadota bacterium]
MCLIDVENTAHTLEQPAHAAEAVKVRQGIWKRRIRNGAVFVACALVWAGLVALLFYVFN